MQTSKNELAKAEKFSLISLPLFEIIPWQRNRLGVAGSELHI
jgi:hypothetical protein